MHPLATAAAHHPQPCCQPSRGLGVTSVAVCGAPHSRARPRPTHCEALPAAAAAGLALAFLPWSGCSQGGFYATGVEGRHGQDCQAMYQPAAAAEERFAARLKQQQQQQQQQQQASSANQLPVNLAAVSDLAPPVANSSSSAGTVSSEASPEQQQPQPQETALAGQQQQQQQQQLTAAEQLQQVPDAAKELVRDVLHEDNRQRTKQLVDDAWQTLE